MLACVYLIAPVAQTLLQVLRYCRLICCLVERSWPQLVLADILFIWQPQLHTALQAVRCIYQHAGNLVGTCRTTGVRAASPATTTVHMSTCLSGCSSTAPNSLSAAGPLQLVQLMQQSCKQCECRAGLSLHSAGVRTMAAAAAPPVAC
eukprot:GHRQ01032122.1.p1 GENE.GHRQ01032122.1~~GHRQ01032122.1.p1  ORF type:complete len:148 (+),score=26.40 GHRQ01032122.1:132-575(+)